MKNFRKNQGITLIALVITVIVLLILAGISISMIAGNNGVLNKAIEAKEMTEEAEDIEKIKLAISDAQIGENGYQELTTDNLENALINDGTKAIVSDNEDGTKHILFLDKKKEYELDSNGNIEDLNIDFDTKYVAPDSQDEERNEGVIGIGTDGNPVDMDLWNYTSVDGEYCVNSKESLDAVMENDWDNVVSGYKGDIENGNIIGEVPIYISEDNGNNYIAVTNMTYTFKKNVELVNSPQLPMTTKICVGTFERCEKLTIVENIPKGVEDMSSMFLGCINLTQICEIPSNVMSMNNTFRWCSELEYSPKINSTVLTTMNDTFGDCTKLKETPYVPDGVIYMERTFRNCTSLEKINNISNNAISIADCFYNCTKLSNVKLEIPISVENIRTTFFGCTNLSGEILITRLPVSYSYCFSNIALQDGKLILKVSEKVYNEFYDSSNLNNIKSIVTNSDDVLMEKIN